jgi:hypothetical protein
MAINKSQNDLARMMIDSPLGKCAADHSGSPVGVVHMDAGKSYSGIGLLLQAHINSIDPQAWEKIKAKIDYTYENFDPALSSLDHETGFSKEMKLRIDRGQKLFFKPNLVAIYNIDPQTFGPDRGSTTCTEWPFLAALMRWFHDKLGIRYWQMAIGEAATTMPVAAHIYSRMHPEGKRVTVEAAIEGKSGNFYGGWGFYFVRKYLQENLNSTSDDDPMQGHEESVSGTYIPPGLAKDKLMVYDLNRIFDDPSKGREVTVPDGIHYKSITLHKAIVGGNPEDKEDRKAYPGCILVNVPKLKVHNITLLTNVIKNLGIGLYPMEAFKKGESQWDYSLPRTGVPAIKGGVPHQVWIAKTDPATGFPQRDPEGRYIVEKTGGITAVMIDIIQAVLNQNIYMLHIVDAVEAINLDHTGQAPGTREPEGMVFAGLDPVATDLLCARYLFSNVSLQDALEVPLEDGCGGRFPQRVPLPVLEGGHIVTREGYDCPLARDVCFERAEKRGLGKRQYYVVGRDTAMNRPMISLQGRLGTVMENKFCDLITRTLYFDIFKMPWDLQQTFFHYLAAADQLQKSSLQKEFLETFDEDGDGRVTYEEFGKGTFGPSQFWLGKSGSIAGTEPFGYLRGPFLMQTTILRGTEALWNPQGHKIRREHLFGAMGVIAYRMSQAALESPDPFFPNLTWGKGKWPSFQFARHIFLGSSLYGRQFPLQAGFPSLYGLAFRYADLTQNQGSYCGKFRNQPDPQGIETYLSDLSSGRKKPLDFNLYIPAGHDKVAGLSMPNVTITTDPAKMLTAAFSGGKEIWTGM